jgi:hypothetical protein
MKKQLYSLFSNKLLHSLALLTILGMPATSFAQAPDLGTTKNFALFTTNGAVLNTGITHITGDVGTNVGSNTGFGNVNGVMQTSNAAAVSDLLVAYNYLDTITATDTIALILADTLYPGVHAIFGNASIPQGLTLDAQGDSSAVFIFQIDGAFATASAAQVILINGAQACNVFWKTEDVLSLATNTIMKGTIVAHIAAINMATGVQLEGRALSIDGAITINGITVHTPAGCGSTLLTGPAAPALGAIDCFSLFSSDGPVDDDGISIVTGDIGTNLGSTTDYNQLTVTGIIHAGPDNATIAAAGDLININTYLTTPQHDIELLYPADLGHSLVLTPHTYIMTAAATLTDTLFLDAQGNPDAVFTIKVNGALTTGTYATVTLLNGTKPGNVYWKIDGLVDINNYSDFVGTIISNGAITMGLGSSLRGRALTTAGALSTATVNVVVPPSPCYPLSVSWVNFTGRIVSNEALLEWTTTNEVNNDFFTLSKSSDGKTFETVTTVKAATATGSFEHSYSYTDPTPYRYYRISQTDYNGTTTYYRVVTLNIPGVSMSEATFYPNPFIGSLTVNVSDASDVNSMELSISDVLGTQVMKTIITQKVTSLSTDLPAGIYYYRVKDNNGNIQSGKLISIQ